MTQQTALSLRTEWSPSRSIWLRWPYRRDIWPQQQATPTLLHTQITEGQGEPSPVPAQQDMLALLQTLATLMVPVDIQVPPAQQGNLTAYLAPIQTAQPNWQCRIHTVDYGDVWLRDCAPFIDEANNAVHFNFDGWGGIDDQYQRDLAARDWLSAHLQLATTQVASVLEGGALHHDGEGTALACSGSILFRPANLGLTDTALRHMLREQFGIEQLLMLPGKFAADETGGHIDNIAAFIAPGEVVVATTDDASHPDYATCRRVLDYLERAKDAQGRRLTLRQLPLPRAPRLSAGEALAIEQRAGVRRRIAGMPLMASYVNFLRFHGAGNAPQVVVVPQFGLPSDEVARNLLAQWLPNYRVVSVSARALLVGGGGWHCASFCA